jgi:hypothetical protein
MVMERSLQAKFLIPIVISLMAGVFVAFFVTLLMVPALYAIGVDITALRARAKRRVRGWFGGSQSDTGVSAPDSV